MLQAATLKDRFSDAPRKHIETRLLTSKDFLVVGHRLVMECTPMPIPTRIPLTRPRILISCPTHPCVVCHLLKPEHVALCSVQVQHLGKRSSWKLPFKDQRGRVNLHLLHVARQVVQTGESSHKKKKIDYKIPDEVKTKVEKLFRDAKMWYRVYGNGKGALEELAPPAAKKDKPRAEESERSPAVSGKATRDGPPSEEEIDEDEVRNPPAIRRDKLWPVLMCLFGAPPLPHPCISGLSCLVLMCPAFPMQTLEQLVGAAAGTSQPEAPASDASEGEACAL